MNKVILIGNLGGDPETINTQEGVVIAKFSMATSEKWRDKNTGEIQDRTEWHRIIAFGRLAEICHEYLSKGRQVCIEGRLQTRSWEREGITRYTTEIIASQMKMLGSRIPNGENNSPKKAEYAINTPMNSGQTESHATDDEIPF
jgi:single-strand DNA-binding protein